MEAECPSDTSILVYQIPPFQTPEHKILQATAEASNLESGEDVSVHTYKHANTQKQFLNSIWFLRPSG
jgi:hypothetical protein